MSTLKVNAITETDGSAFPFGKVLQAVSTTKTDHFSTTSSSLAEVTGLNVSITPSAATSKIHLNIDVSVGGATAYVGFNIKRDSTLIAVTTAVSGDNRHQASFGNTIVQNSAMKNTGFNFLDTPNTTSAITYKVFVISQYNNQTVNINRTYNTTNNLFDQGGCSTITAMEVAA
tara:strand:+ start:750 stop:1268 length:519 start_codon:yes stop_codon:yes gene_type:complete